MVAVRMLQAVAGYSIAIDFIGRDMLSLKAEGFKETDDGISVSGNDDGIKGRDFHVGNSLFIF